MNVVARPLAVVLSAFWLVSCASAPPDPDSWEAQKHRVDPCVDPERAAYFDARTDAERRHVYHCQIMAGIQVHDACMGLQRVADASSVPDLIYALKLKSPVVLPDGREAAIDTTHICAGVLRRVTGQSFGLWPKEWEAWWVAGGHPPVPDPPVGSEKH